MVIANVPTPIALPFAFFQCLKKLVFLEYFYLVITTLIQEVFPSKRRILFRIERSIWFNHFRGLLYQWKLWNAFWIQLCQTVQLSWQCKCSLWKFNYKWTRLPWLLQTKIYNIQWSHSRDNKANPNSSFSASVNLGSSKYFKRSINQINIGSNLNNTMNSSVSYSRNFVGAGPQSRLSVTATHSQNTQTEQIDMTLPTLQYSIDRMYPFCEKRWS